MLAMNMQTSFMHPPFGFSLFYLRSVAPSRPYKDKVTGATIPPVTSGQIYMGSIPFLLIQVVAVGVIIAFPGLVTHYKGNHPQVDPASIQINVPMPDAGGGNPFGNAPAPFGAPSPAVEPLPAPSFGSPAPSFGQGADQKEKPAQ